MLDDLMLSPPPQSHPRSLLVSRAKAFLNGLVATKEETLN